MRRNVKYWAVKFDFDYNVLVLPEGKAPSSDHWDLIEGPYPTLFPAKIVVQDWLINDVGVLTTLLTKIEKLKVKDFLKRDTGVGYWG